MDLCGFGEVTEVTVLLMGDKCGILAAGFMCCPQPQNTKQHTSQTSTVITQVSGGDRMQCLIIHKAILVEARGKQHPVGDSSPRLQLK